MDEAAQHFERGVQAFKSGDYDNAVNELETATQMNHEDYRAFNYLGAAYAAKNRYNAAIGAFKTAEQIAPHVASIHYNIGQAYEATGIMNEAEYEYGRAVELNPDYSRAREALERVKKKLHHI